VPFTNGVVEFEGETGTVEVTVGVAVLGVLFRLTSSMVMRFAPALLLA
jgi:hypothetical protein